MDIKIPRPSGGSRQSAGVGKIFVKFDTPASAGKALRTLAGRKFADRTVVTTYFSEVRDHNLWSFGYANMICRRTLRLALGSPSQGPRIIRELSYNLYLNRAILHGVTVIKP